MDPYYLNATARAAVKQLEMNHLKVVHYLISFTAEERQDLFDIRAQSTIAFAHFNIVFNMYGSQIQNVLEDTYAENAQGKELFFLTYEEAFNYLKQQVASHPHNILFFADRKQMLKHFDCKHLQRYPVPVEDDLEDLAF